MEIELSELRKEEHDVAEAIITAFTNEADALNPSEVFSVVEG
jgi:hypothetical protein